jgi:hypothetical protein
VSQQPATDALTVAKFLQHRIWPRFAHPLRAAIRGAQSGHEKATDPRPPDCSDRPRNFSAQTTLPMTGVSAGRWSLFRHLVLAAFAQAISVGLLRLPTPADFQHQNPSGSGPVFRVAFQPLAAPDGAPLERRFAGAVSGPPKRHRSEGRSPAGTLSLQGCLTQPASGRTNDQVAALAAAAAQCGASPVHLHPQ